VILFSVLFYHTQVSAQARPTLPTVQMLSTSYNLQHSGGSPGQSITLETLSFSVNGTAKMEVTSLNNALSVNVDLDGVELAPAPTGNSHSDLTVTDTSVPAGSHTLTVSWIDVCGCGGVSGDIHGSLSIIVTTGV